MIKKSKVKKTSQKTLKARADKMWSEAIRARGSCENCGSTQYLQAAHVISRKYGKTRHDLRNGFCLCARCHRNFHDNPVDFGVFVSSKRTPEEIGQLRLLSNMGGKPDYERAIELLKDKI